MFLSPPPPPFPARPFLTFPNVLSPPYPVLVFFAISKRRKRPLQQAAPQRVRWGEELWQAARIDPADRLYWARAGRGRGKLRRLSLSSSSFSVPPAQMFFPSCRRLASGMVVTGGEASFYPPFPPKGKRKKPPSQPSSGP